MKFVIGGSFQGKLKYAATTFGLEPDEFIDGAFCGEEEVFTCRGIYHFHLYIRRLLEQEKPMDGFLTRLRKENQGIVIVSEEIGYGIVPIDSFERQYREAVGRTSTEIAAESTEVHRVVCGIGTVIKHD
jgi:adenosylcobinamide kinase/adenosylcobinamide-phosphate guanylyltransferase